MPSRTTTAHSSPRLPVVVVPQGWSRSEGAMKKESSFKGLVNILSGVAVGYWGKRFMEDRIFSHFIVDGAASLYNYIIGINNWLAIYTSVLLTILFLVTLRFSWLI